MYLINCSLALRTVWNAAKHFVYPSTREKFRILGSDVDAIMRQFVAYGVQLSALPAYLGGTGLNPPGLVLQRQLRANAGFSVQLAVPVDHTVFYRFQASKPTTVIGTCSEGKSVCNFQIGGPEWLDGALEERKDSFSIIFKFSSPITSLVHYEITIQPRARFRPAPSPVARQTPPGAPNTAWITKRRQFRDSVRSLDQTPLEGRKGRMSKWGSWHTGYQSRFFQVNNEYLNYFADEETAGPLLGSYNLKKLLRVEADSKGGLILSFDGKHTVWLRAPSLKEAQLWVACLEERRQWFEDIPTAADSAKKKAVRDSQRSVSLPPALVPTLALARRGSAKPSQPRILLLCTVCVFFGIFLGTLLS